jgi:protein-S-isoprenylcysteine O-methyltransferase Ste14
MAMFAKLYALFAYIGVMVIPASFIMGFKYDPTAPASNYVYDIVLYLIYIGIHFLMTVPAFKKMVYGKPQGSSAERRVYVTISVVTWIVLYAVHKPLPGFEIAANQWIVFFGLCLVLVGQFAFFEFGNFDALNALFGVPGSGMSHSAGGETPLMTEGSYSKVRHPMYRAALILYMSSVIMHPNTAQLLFAVMVSLSFLVFIPIEEAGLIRGRGEQYRAYQQTVKWRVIRGIW